MNIAKPKIPHHELIAIIEDTTLAFKERPHLTMDANIVVLDFLMTKVAVDKNKARDLAPRLITLLKEFDAPKIIQGEPSYLTIEKLLNGEPLEEKKTFEDPEIEDGDATLRIKPAKLKSTDLALRLFALGCALGLWQITTPEDLGLKGQQAQELAEQGMILIHEPDPSLL